MTLLSHQMLIWIAATVAIYWRLPMAAQVPFVALVTLAFLLFYAPVSGGVLLAISLVTYAASRATPTRRWAGLTAVGVLAAGFFAYKLTLTPQAGGAPTEILLLGFSFYVLRAIHYLVESDKGMLPEHTFPEFLAFMFFLPTLLVGPIHRFAEFHREVRRRRWDGALFSLGLERILFGYAKILILATFLVQHRLGRFIHKLPAEQSFLQAYLECLQYGLNLYFQFAGYSDVAIGFALLLGIRLAENFRFPFLQTNISDFWRSWHMSLSSWCRDYIHTPLIARTRQPLIAVVGSMMVLGLWHELSPRYVLWGAYHGAGIMAWQSFQGWKPALLNTAHPVARAAVTGGAWFLTFNFVVLSFAITKEATLSGTLDVLKHLLFM